MEKIKSFIGLFLIAICPVLGQTEKHLIYFRDKVGTPFSIERPQEFLSAKSLARRQKNDVVTDQRDLPVNPNYVGQVRALGATVLNTTKWLNGAIVEATSDQLASVLALPFVLRGQLLQLPGMGGGGKDKFGKEDLNPNKSTSINLDYGGSENQIRMLGIDVMHNQGITGKNVAIAVLDAGFPGVNTHKAFDSLFAQNRYKGGYDYVFRTNNVFQQFSHGSLVLSNIAAFLPGKIIGGAYDADIYLYTTEDGGSEYEIECAYWLVAAEKADSLGVDVINNSLGYNTFDNPTQDYTYSMLDGKTTIISKAANIAGAKGIIVVTSAGNAGNNQQWGGYITAPADADSILTVGAVTSSRLYAGFSSRGPSADGRVKPDVMAQGVANTIIIESSRDDVSTGSGTSFASPMIAGLVAGLLQKFPTIKAMDLIQAIKMSGDSSLATNNRVGYGIPNFQRIVNLVTTMTKNKQTSMFHVYPNPISEHINIMLPISELTNATYKIYNLNGQLVDKGEVDVKAYRASLKASHLENGLYRILIQNQTGRNYSAPFFKH